jgi:hypothetical protein
VSIQATDVAIQRLRVNLPGLVNVAHWRADYTWLLFVGPMLRALVWDPSHPEECRLRSPGPCRVGYVLFGGPDVNGASDRPMVPVLVIEAVSLSAALDEAATEFGSFAEAGLQMRKGTAVLTDGRHWWIYDVTRSKVFSGGPAERVDVLKGKRLAAARTLSEWLGRSALSELS